MINGTEWLVFIGWEDQVGSIITPRRTMWRSSPNPIKGVRCLFVQCFLTISHLFSMFTNLEYITTILRAIFCRATPWCYFLVRILDPLADGSGFFKVRRGPCLVISIKHCFENRIPNHCNVKIAKEHQTITNEASNDVCTAPAPTNPTPCCPPPQYIDYRRPVQVLVLQDF